MNCRYARETINTVMDGEGHPLAAEAREHIGECASCREWQAGMDHALEMLQASETPPAPDISAMVMSKLPAAHPASRRTEPAGLSPRRAISWLGAGWVVGAMIIAAAIFTILPRLDLGGLGPAVEVVKNVLRPLLAVLLAARAAAVLIGHSAVAVARAIGIGPALAVPFSLDLALAGIGVLIWHRRRLPANACLA